MPEIILLGKRQSLCFTETGGFNLPGLKGSGLLHNVSALSHKFRSQEGYVHVPISRTQKTVNYTGCFRRRGRRRFGRKGLILVWEDEMPPKGFLLFP